MNWGVIRTESEGVHVVPMLGEQIAREHTARRLCSCRPTPKRESPLDEPVWSHHEPGWPGSKEGVN